MKLSIWNKNGNVSRQVCIPGRNPYKAAGRVNFMGNYAERGEQEWDAIKALMAEGNCSIELSPYECDVVMEKFGHDKFPCGPNVTFELPPTHRVNWRLVAEDGLFARFTDQTEPGTPELYCCGKLYESPNQLQVHRQGAHREGELQPHANPKAIKTGHMEPHGLKGSPAVYEARG